MGLFLERAKQALEQKVEHACPIHWCNLAEGNMHPDHAENEQDQLFLIALRVFRAAETPASLRARWDGLRRYLSEQLPVLAIAVLRREVERGERS